MDISKLIFRFNLKTFEEAEREARERGESFDPFSLSDAVSSHQMTQQQLDSARAAGKKPAAVWMWQDYFLTVALSAFSDAVEVRTNRMKKLKEKISKPKKKRSAKNAQSR